MSKHLTNYHSHCDFCDGRAPMEDFVKSAINEGFSSYGVSSHAPLPDYAGHNVVLQWNKVDSYLAEVARLKAKYADRIELYTSMEIDYIDNEHNPANAYFQALPLDYRIGSVHFIKVGPRQLMDADTRPENFMMDLQRFYDNDIKRLVTDYFDAKMRMVELGGFDFIGHADKVSLNASRFDSSILGSDWYRTKIKEYFNFISERGVMVEINTKAFHTSGLFFPNIEHFLLIKSLNIPIVVNSDSHSPHLVNSGRMEAIELLRQVGFTEVMELNSGKWQAMQLRAVF